MRKTGGIFTKKESMKAFCVLFLFTIFILTLTDCTKKSETVNSIEAIIAEARRSDLPDEYYPYYETLFFNHGKGYEFKNVNSNKLIISLRGGPDWRSAIGRIGDRIVGDRFIDLILPMHDEYNIFIPEKFDWEVGINYLYYANTREQYTVDNLLVNYAEVINEYLLQNDYDAVIIIGKSEGAILLPELYFQLEEYNKISALISIAGGGLSKYELYEITYNKILAEEKPFTATYINVANWIEEIKLFLDAYREEPYPDSSERIRDYTSRWHTSIMFRRPENFYVDIEIPVLFIHGEMDRNIPVESTRYVEYNLPYKPFDFIYYPEMEHNHGTSEVMRMREDIANWLRKQGL